jgi:hypothetical protein
VKLVGFGCSFTYGSELFEIGEDPNTLENIRYRNKHCWLGQLAQRFDCERDNLAQPANSNYAIQYQVADYIKNTWKRDEKIVVCVAWTEPARFSWLDDKWTHNGTVRNDQKFLHSRSDWLKSIVDHNYWTDAAKLNVNAVCKYYNIPILQFNAIGKHTTTQYPNYFLDGATMQSVLEPEHFASGGHPNELGHEWFTKRLYLFAKEHIIV